MCRTQRFQRGSDSSLTLYDQCYTSSSHGRLVMWSREERYLWPEALDLFFQIAPSGLRREELFHHAARPLITRNSLLKVLRRRLAVRCSFPLWRTAMNTALEAAVTIGVGIDTARYGHRVTFLKADKQPAAPPLDVLESAAGYEELRQALERLGAARAASQVPCAD